MRESQPASGDGLVLPRFLSGVVPYRFVQVDAARLLLILARFAWDITDETRGLRCFPARPVTRHFSPEYYLQKLDFLVRYPGYLAYELAAFHKAGRPEARDREEMIALVRRMIVDREPDRLVLPFQRFWRGAYERLDDVEAWWHSRELLFTGQEARGGARPQKHYFLTEQGLCEAERLVMEVSEARWYSERIALIHRFFASLTPAEVKELHYRHPGYRDAQLQEAIPELTPEAIEEAFLDAFEEALEVDIA